MYIGRKSKVVQFMLSPLQCIRITDNKM